MCMRFFFGTPGIYILVRKKKGFRWAWRETLNALYSFLLVNGCWENRPICFFSFSLIFSMLPVSWVFFPFFPETAWFWHGPSAPSSLKEMVQPPATVHSSPEPFHSSGSGSSLFMTIWLLVPSFHYDRHNSFLAHDWCRQEKKKSYAAGRRCWCFIMIGPCPAISRSTSLKKKSLWTSLCSPLHFID